MSNAPPAGPTDGDETDVTPAEFDPSVLEILRCPITHERLTHRGDELWCAASGKAYPISDGIPVMIVEEARDLTDEERRQLTP